mmetsp:Transcript_14783/g.22267  ORF Transcript_14783/g.22267 Transcript_14783/m.22267 type:complete len:309 (+) Transcript_14783:89-1015(+)|eukprot:CAMPEP_0185034750 /NCGR_PEP_ID=MMETSP1103-20130426/24888_1 /TAXON_ID=36769 /ORGANISM="Paraphysomonas bandaiensis, Strain Caron Lab Isolate" /LENGTH=308 /DNA_ID=CAMNT_0027571531 /DNA_START=87 /DNA_END=1013 /DNA_ORIENTATION=+
MISKSLTSQVYHCSKHLRSLYVLSRQNSTAVITGGASGIGLALAKSAVSRDYNIVLVDIEESRLSEAVSELKVSSDRILAVKCDVSKEDEMASLADKVFDRFGSVQLLCNNAGVGATKMSWEHTKSDWDWVLGVNMWSIIHANRFFIPRMLKQDVRSRILNTASAAGLISTPGMIAYNVSKHAVVTMSETLYHELRDVNAPIDVSVLCPAFIPTGIAASHRNRPPALSTDCEDMMASEYKDANMKYAAGLVKAVKSGKKSADEVAEHVFEAMDKGDFYIVPHRKILGAVHQRCDDIVNLKSPTVMVPA